MTLRRRTSLRCVPRRKLLEDSSRRGRRLALALALGLGAVATVLSGAAPRAQDGPKPYPIYTAAHLAGTMETLGPNFAAAVRALEAGDHPVAKERLARAREQLATTITFWRQRERNDAIRFVRTAIDGMDDLDAALSGESVDARPAAALAGEVEATCNACHAVYREEDPAGGYRLKPGSIQPPSS